MNSMSTVSPASEGALPSAQDCFSEVIQAEAAEARKQSKGEIEKKKLLEQFSKPSGVSDEQRLKRATSIIRRAVRSRLTEVEIGRFPNQLCTDRGRAIIQAESGWEDTLTGLPKELHAFWRKHLAPLGYKIHVRIVDWPGGMPGDVGIALSWKQEQK
jgi:hypothetical protein